MHHTPSPRRRQQAGHLALGGPARDPRRPRELRILPPRGRATAFSLPLRSHSLPRRTTPEPPSRPHSRDGLAAGRVSARAWIPRGARVRRQLHDRLTDLQASPSPAPARSRAGTGSRCSKAPGESVVRSPATATDAVALPSPPPRARVLTTGTRSLVELATVPTARPAAAAARASISPPRQPLTLAKFPLDGAAPAEAASDAGCSARERCAATTFCRCRTQHADTSPRARAACAPLSRKAKKVS